MPRRRRNEEEKARRNERDKQRYQANRAKEIEATYLAAEKNKQKRATAAAAAA